MSVLRPLPSFPYHFVPRLSDASSRRDVLDSVGRYTQIASDLFVVVVFIYFNFSALQARGQKRPNSSKSANSQAQRWTNDRLNTTFLTGQKETKGSVVITLAWTALILALIFWRSGDDYLHITRSPAQVASALLGVNIVFSLPFLRDHTPQLISFHRLQSILIFTLLIAHAVLYLNFYIQNNLLAKRIQDIDVQLGIALAILSAGLWFTGARMQAIKSKLGVHEGRLVHVCLTTVFGIALWYHVLHAHINLRRAGLVWAMGQAWRVLGEFGGVKSMKRPARSKTA